MSNDTIIFRAINEFVHDLASVFGTEFHPLKLYSHLLSKTKITHNDAVGKHITLFKNFCEVNTQSIINRDKINIVSDISYTNKVHINIYDIFKSPLMDNDTEKAVWNHLLTIYSLLFPDADIPIVTRDIIISKSTSTEMDFIGKFTDKIEGHIDENKSVMENVSALFEGGVLNDIIGEFGNSIKNGTINIKDLLGTATSMASQLDDGTNSEISSISSVLSSLQYNTPNTLNDTQPDIANIMSMFNSINK